MVKDVYTNIQSKIKINGLLSDPFTLTREVCQGCLFSMLLYIIAAEVLASFINANKRIKGIQIGDHEIKIVNFADDTTIFLRDITCLNRLMILKLYEDAPSSKINFSKSQNFGNSILDNCKWYRISEDMAKNPCLKLRGKKIIVNQPSYPKNNTLKRNTQFLLEQEKIQPLRYLAQLLIWMIGLGILDIETQLNSLKIKWIQRLLNPTNAPWINLMLYQLNLILNYNQGLALFR